MAQDYERLGAFYLGRLWDSERNTAKDELLLYDSKDLTTHAVCVGMTGSGKTGLCISLLEEAALDGIPAVVIDPKGDLGNLLLAFPELRPADFRPWVDEGEAARQGLTADALAAKTAENWSKGLAEWGQDGARVARFRSSADVAIYTPGSSAGLPLTVLKSFAAPPRALVEDADAFRERVLSAVSGLLALLRIEADPIRSREHILLSTLLDRAWREGRDLEIAQLIREIQTPPFRTLGVMELDSFYPAKERLELSLALNNLLASPGFAGWMEGEPLDIARLLWTPGGRPRLSILSIAHLGDAERMFFVTLLLNELVAWMRCQPGTSSLRALLYMDEVFGFFPPTANPPSKIPMLTLMKQARAFGLGVVLATQNPVDLDYKGLSNAGTWLLGRLQTERDKSRVLEGLEGASAAAGAHFDRQRMEATLAGLANRVFLMNNVHEDEPVLFQSRWALSYLRGPLTKTQIQTLMAPLKQSSRVDHPSVAPAPVPPPPAAAQVAAPPPPTPGPASGPGRSQARPIVPSEAGEAFLPWTGSLPEGASLVYRPALSGRARVHYVAAKAGLDWWEEVALLAPLVEGEPEGVWESAEVCAAPFGTAGFPPDPRVGFSALPPAALRPGSYASWSRLLVDFLYRSRSLTLWSCPSLQQSSRPGESEGNFRVRLNQLGREARDAKVEALRARFAPRLAALQGRIRAAEERVGREQAQFQQQTMQTAISVGATVLGALFGRKAASAGNVGRATTAMRGMGRSMREKGDIGRASENVELLRRQLADLEAEFQAESARVQELSDPARLSLVPVAIRPRKSDLIVTQVQLLWTPWRILKDGAAEPAFR